MRRVITEQIQTIAKQFLGREISTQELRLYPYIDYVIKNNNLIDLKKINNDEFMILLDLIDEHHIYIDGTYLTITRSFYDYLQNILAESYVCKWRE